MRSRLGELRMSAREASRRAGLNVGYAGDFLEGRSKAPEIDRIMKLAEVLDMPLSELDGGDSVESESKSVTIPQGLSAHSIGAEAGMVPLYAAKITMSEPLSLMSAQPVGFVPALPALLHVRDAYAVTVFNTMNEPRYFLGELIYMSPAATPQPGDFTFGKLRSDGRVGIGRFLGIEGGKARFERISAPEGVDRFATYDLDDIEFFHRIVASVAAG